MSTEYITRITRLTVIPNGDPIFSETATNISIDDEAAGEFIVVEQDGDAAAKIKIDKEEWPAIKAAIDLLMKELK